MLCFNATLVSDCCSLKAKRHIDFWLKCIN